MKVLKTYFILIIPLILTGCASSPRAAKMVPPTSQYQFTNTEKTLTVKFVFGGRESDPLFTGSKIDNASFMAALVQALTNSNIFKQVNPTDGKDYYLKVFVLTQDQPFIGLNMTVKLLVRYEIFAATDDSLLWQKDIFSEYTATMGDCLIGSIRLNKANEGAVRENIRMLLGEISKLEL